MRLSLSIPHLALSAAALSIPAAAQTASAHGLLSEDEVLANGHDVMMVDRCFISENGSWVMRVFTNAFRWTVLQDGEIVLDYGDAISTGETVEWIDDLDMSPGGLVAYTLEVSDGTDHRHVVYANDRVRLSTDDTFVDPAVSPDAYTMHRFSDAAIADPYMVVTAVVSGGGDPATRSATVLFDFSVPLASTAQILAEEGRPAPGGGTFTFSEFNPAPHLDVLPDGRTLAHVEVDGDAAVLFDGAIVARVGQPTPDPAYLWSTYGPKARVGPAGHLLIDGKTELAYDGSSAGDRVFVDGVMRLYEGQPFGSETSGSLSYDGYVDDQGRLHYCHYMPSFGGYARDDDMIMESDLCTIDGELADFTWGLWFAGISDSGKYAIVQARIEEPYYGFRCCLVETDLGRTVTACAAVPNSTGAIGRLEASGSSYLGAGTFPMTGVDLPVGEFAYLLCSTTPNVTPNPAGSSGTLCLGGTVNTFTSQLDTVDADGSVTMTVDPLAIPQTGGTVAAIAGETWGFQIWHQDTTGAGSTTNFTEARAVTFR